MTTKSDATFAREGHVSRAVVGAFGILDVLSQSNQPLRLSRIVERSGIPKTSALRIISTLADIGAVTRVAPGGHYQLGVTLKRYVPDASAAEIELVRAFYQIAIELRQDLDETIQLAILTPPAVTFIARIDTAQPVRLATQIGRQLPAHATGVGKAILAHSPDAVVNEVIAHGLHRMTDHTITDPNRLFDVLATIRRQGYATEVEESSLNLSCFSAAVLGSNGYAIAGVTVCVPRSEVDVAYQRRIITAVRRAASSLERQA